jgi:trehalose synthase-fused probable maltokinase
MDIDIGPLIEQLPQQRWFGAKGKTIAAWELVDSAEAPTGDMAFAIVRVRLHDDEEQLYSLPLVRKGDGWCDAFDDLTGLRDVCRWMVQNTTLDGSRGVFRLTGPGLDPEDPPGIDVRPAGFEQTNTSMIVDDTYIIKFFRRVQDGPNPELELMRLLTNTGFEHIPPHVGEGVYEGSEEGAPSRIDLIVGTHYMKDSEEGWTFALRKLRDLYDEVDPADAREDLAFLVEERASELLRWVDQLGDVSADMHVTLSHEEPSPELEPDIHPEPLETTELKELGESVHDAVDRLIAGGLKQLEELVPAIDEKFARASEVSDAGLKIRVHNDYHLGQVLLTGRGWMILDFEGEPARSLEERRSKQSPFKDVAGMLRSFNYAATAVLFERDRPGSDEWKRLEPWAEEWERIARDRFLAAYLTRGQTEGRFLPADRDTWALLIDAFEIDKAVYEIEYEQAHRPDWVRIPLRGLQNVLFREAE